MSLRVLAYDMKRVMDLIGVIPLMKALLLPVSAA